MWLVWKPGPWFNIKMSSYQYRNSHCGVKTILRPSYLHNEISYTGMMSSLHWIRALHYSARWGVGKHTRQGFLQEILIMKLNIYIYISISIGVVQPAGQRKPGLGLLPVWVRKWYWWFFASENFPKWCFIFAGNSALCLEWTVLLPWLYFKKPSENCAVL